MITPLIELILEIFAGTVEMASEAEEAKKGCGCILVIIAGILIGIVIWFLATYD